MAKPQSPPGAGANGQGGHGDIDALYLWSLNRLFWFRLR